MPNPGMKLRRTLVMFIENIFAKKFGENVGVFAQTTASFSKHLIITLVFKKNADFSLKIGKNRRKL
jgi:hypothetical protein